MMYKFFESKSMINVIEQAGQFKIVEFRHKLINIPISVIKKFIDQP